VAYLLQEKEIKIELVLIGQLLVGLCPIAAPVVSDWCVVLRSAGLIGHYREESGKHTQNDWRKAALW